MFPDFARRNRPSPFLTAASRKCLAGLIFACMVVPAAFATGAGKSNVACQGTIISPSDDIVSIINSGKRNQTFCIEGEHRITASIQVLTGQSLIGTTPDSRISAAVIVGPWQPTATQGVYYYDGPYAAIQPDQQDQLHSGGANVCYWVTTYEDDLFFQTSPGNDQRVMRVLSETEVDPTKPVTTQGQAITAGEAGRFFFDYPSHRIYLSLPSNQDPNTVTVDLSISLGNLKSNSLIYGPGQTNVTLQNLFLEKGMTYGIFGGSSWTLKDMTIQFIHNVGAYDMMGSATQPAIIDDTLFSNNGRMALNAAFTSNVNITNSEMSWNNIANFRAATGPTGSGVCQGYNDAGAFHIYGDIGTPSKPSVIINNLWSHDNIGDGLWSDGGTQFTQITNSTFNGNERYGYFHEISCQVLFSSNTVYNNGYPLKNPDVTGGGVDVSDSNNATFSSNLLYDNYAGYAFHLTLQTSHPHMDSNPCLGGANGGDTSHALKNNQVLSNNIYACSGEASIGKVWGPGGTLNSRGNVYQSNHYHLADSTSNWFSDGDSTNNYVPEDWSAWQQGNHDTQGVLTVGCTYVAQGSVGTTTTLSVAPASVDAKAIGPIVATAVVKPATGSEMPTGTVNFFNGVTQVGSAALNNGDATFNYNPSLLAAGAYSITATYFPDGNFGTSTSAPQALSVQDFQIAANPATVTVSVPGQDGATTLTLTPLGGFSQALTYTCAGLPLGATCTFTSTSATTETITIQTAAASARLDKTRFSRANGLLYAFILPGFLGLVVSGWNRKRTLRGVRFLGLLAVLTASTLGMLACAGLSSGSQNVGSQSKGGTPIGKSSVTVTAATGGVNPLNHNVIVALTVQ
jgi:hypothetical protein